MEQQVQQSKEIVRFVDIGVLEEEYSSAWNTAFSFVIPKKNGTIRVVTDLTKFNLLKKVSLSPSSYSKDWGYDPFNRRVYHCASIELKYGLLLHQTICW
jgi:hypothetical protein